MANPESVPEVEEGARALRRWIMDRYTVLCEGGFMEPKVRGFGRTSNSGYFSAVTGTFQHTPAGFGHHKERQKFHPASS